MSIWPRSLHSLKNIFTKVNHFFGSSLLIGFHDWEVMLMFTSTISTLRWRDQMGHRWVCLPHHLTCSRSHRPLCWIIRTGFWIYQKKKKNRSGYFDVRGQCLKLTSETLTVKVVLDLSPCLIKLVTLGIKTRVIKGGFEFKFPKVTFWSFRLVDQFFVFSYLLKTV